MEKKIFVLDNTYVYVGIGQRVDDPLLGDSVRITHCKNIRRYGTEKGLTELSYTGKKEETILDESLPITVPINRIIHTIDIEVNVQKTFD